MVHIGGSSYRGFELSKFRVIKGSRYQGLLLLRVRFIEGLSYRESAIKPTPAGIW